MNTTDRAAHEELERVVHEWLRRQPLRSAPHDLQQRVVAEIQRRAALPWWRKDYSHWPSGARIGFVLVAIALLGLVRMLGQWLSTEVAAGSELQTLGQHATALQTIADVTASIVRNIPGIWIYGPVVLLVALYGCVLGISATAYRNLCVSR